MNRSILFRVFAVVLLVALAIGGGAMVYDAGVNAGLQQAAAQAAATGEAAPVVPYAYGPHGWGYGGGWGSGGGFGFFGIFFWILGFFLIFGLLRAAFGGGRWGGPARWGGPDRWGGPGGPGGQAGPGADGRRAMHEELHRDMHRADSGEPARPAGA